ncbi:hypothetical protein GQ600_3714 [Phytophthora cactorum]|nr:hypothetical protein GQ600_3714 [Phytophthora cactorum]
MGATAGDGWRALAAVASSWAAHSQPLEQGPGRPAGAATHWHLLRLGYGRRQGPYKAVASIGWNPSSEQGEDGGATSTAQVR